MKRLNLMGAFLLLIFVGSSSFSMVIDENGAPFFGLYSWSPNQALLPLKEFPFFTVKERKYYAQTVLKLGYSNPEDHENYDLFVDQFENLSYGDEYFVEKLRLLEFQDGVKKIMEIKEIHEQILCEELSRRKLKKLEERIKRRLRIGKEKLSLMWSNKSGH